MGAPTDPTTLSITTAALTRFEDGGASEADALTRAQQFGFEKVKRDIMLIGKKWRPLLKTSYQITVINQARYDNPADFETDFRVAIMTGIRSSVIAGVTSPAIITLNAGATKIEAEGKWLLITSGTGINQAQQIVSYDVATNKATLADGFDTPPVTGDGYLIVNSSSDIPPLPESFFNLLGTTGTPGTPVRYSQKENATVGQIVLHPIPATVMGIKRDYYADFMKLDTTEGAGQLYTTILRRWATVLEQGIYVWKLGEDDDRYQAENGLYQDMLVAMMARDLVGYVPKQQAAGGK
jgi:hypothetical protein